jgi:hypothetical protein
MGLATAPLWPASGGGAYASITLRPHRYLCACNGIRGEVADNRDGGHFRPRNRRKFSDHWDRPLSGGSLSEGYDRSGMLPAGDLRMEWTLRLVGTKRFVAVQSIGQVWENERSLGCVEGLPHKTPVDDYLGASRLCRMVRYLVRARRISSLPSTAFPWNDSYHATVSIL